MAYGISVQNTSGTVILAEDYSNYMIVSSGTVSNGSGLPTVTGDDLLFVRPHSIPSPQSLYFTGGNTPVLQSTSTAIAYVLLRRNPTASSDTYGLRIKRADGSIAFDSGRSPLTPVFSYRDTSNESTSAGSVTMTSVSAPFSAPTGRKRYVLWNNLLGFITWGLSGTTAMYIFSKVTWNSEDSFSIGADWVSSGNTYASIGYSSASGSLYYFFAEFAQ